MAYHHPLTERIKEARGKQWVAMKTAIFRDIGPELKADIGDQKLTLARIGALCIVWNLQFKTLMEWLEQEQIIPYGKTRMILERTKIKGENGGKDEPFRVATVLEAGQKWLDENGKP